MSTPALGAAPTPKDAATRPGWGLANADAEARRRVVLAILPYNRDPDAVVDLAEYILAGPDVEDES